MPAMADDLEHWLADQPVSAFIEPLSTKAMRWVRRRKQWVAAAASLALMSVAGLSVHDFRLGQEQVLTKRALDNLAQEQVLTRQALEVTGQEQLRTRDALDNAAAQLRMTRDALRGLLQVAGEGLANFANSDKMRAELASQVLDSYKLLGQKFPNDPDVQLETAQVYRVVAGIELMTGQYDKARQSIATALQFL